MKRYFVTGTDTDCGKTYVTCQLLAHMQAQKERVMGIKPVASGLMDDKPINPDVAALSEYRHADYPISRWQYTQPMSPHLAARDAGESLSASDIADFCNQYPGHDLDLLLVEGAGGLMVPLNPTETWVDVLLKTQMPIILVVQMRLGCLNHALLTDAVIRAHQLPFAGWIANLTPEPMLGLTENIQTLVSKMSAPLITTVEYCGTIRELQRFWG